MEINPGLAAEAPAHASSHSVVNPFDWIEPLDSINTTSGDGGEVSFSAASEYSGERYQQSPRPLRSLLNTHHDEFTATTERKRELQSLCQGAPLRRKKKPKSLPKRPLSAYNLYFQRVRADLNSDGGSRIGFHELGKIVGKKWKSLSEENTKFTENWQIKIRRDTVGIWSSTTRLNRRRRKRGTLNSRFGKKRASHLTDLV